MKKKTVEAVEQAQPDVAAAQPNTQAELQALKATAYELLLERVRIENILRQVEQRITQLQQPASE